MRGKILERECLSKTIAFIPNARKLQKGILELLKGDIVESESPDFLIRHDGEVVGVEHFLVDTLLGKKKASRNCLRQSEICRTYNTYHKCIEGNEDKALNEIESIIQADVDSVQKFDYVKFIKEFDRIFTNHASKVHGYKSNQDNNFKMVFLVEIHIAKNKLVGINYKFQKKVIKGRRFPITADMLRVIKENSKEIDYVVICIMHDHYKNKPFTVYTIDCEQFEESIAHQIDEVFYKFTYDWQLSPLKADVQLSLEKKEV